MTTPQRRSAECAPARRATSDRQNSQYPVVLSPPTEDQEDYLKTIELSSDEYDPSVIVGGPRNIRA